MTEEVGPAGDEGSVGGLGIGRRNPLTIGGLAVALTVASGAADALSFMRLGGVFTSVMTGNLVLLGLAIGTADVTLAVHTAAAFGGYVIGTAIGSLLATRPSQDKGVWPNAVTVSLCVELAAIMGFTAGWEIAGPHPSGTAQLALLSIAACAMGVQSAAIREVEVRSTTYFTGILTGVVAGLALPRRRPNPRSLIQLLALAVGAGVSALLVTRAPSFAPALQVVLLTVVVGVAAIRR